jgi:hypothetical protein
MIPLIELGIQKDKGDQAAQSDPRLFGVLAL